MPRHVTTHMLAGATATVERRRIVMRGPHQFIAERRIRRPLPTPGDGR